MYRLMESKLNMILQTEKIYAAVVDLVKAATNVRPRQLFF